ncbi:MAG: hypothetical protein BWY93_01605 [Euryarchaeota archaeon ADurb.BinA087]|nr:MAG: hypothetical protein BWY93_01605 [Euryarchaeota archaeon ADurb.BinA087]
MRWASKTGVPTLVQTFRYWVIPPSRRVMFTISLIRGPERAFKRSEQIRSSTRRAISRAVSSFALS